MKRLALATGGLFFAWLAHDLEELVTMAPAQAAGLRVPAWVPVPAAWRARGMGQHHVNVAVTLMGLVVAAGAIDGWRTSGRGWFYQNSLEAFGLHGFGHMAASLATRGYTSGVVTSPTIVIPAWLWATRTLRARGVPDRRSRVAALALAASTLAALHAAAYAITREWPLPRA